MNSYKIFLTALLLVAGLSGLQAQTGNCQAYFTYTYTPWLSQPEESIYAFTDSSTGEDSSTTYSWNFGNGDFAGTKNTGISYEPDDSGFRQVCLTIRNADNGCTSTYCDTIRIDNLCLGARYAYSLQGNTGTFIASICGQYDSIRWDLGDGTIVTGKDTVIHTFAAGADSFNVCMQVFLSAVCEYNYPCHSYQCETIRIYPAGVNDIAQSDEHVKVYPDPASSLISIAGGKLEFPAEIKITDITGKTLLLSQLKFNNQQFDITSLQSGIYFIEIDTGLKQNLVTRFVKL